MKKTVILIIALFTIGVLSQGSIIAQKRGNQKGNKCDFHRGNPFEMIDLTEEQENTISDLRYENQMKAIELRSQLKQNKLKLEKLFAANDVDESKIMRIVDENNDIHAQLSKMRMEMRLKMRSILTPDQRDQLREEMKSRPRFGMGRDNNFGERDRDFRSIRDCIRF